MVVVVLVKEDYGNLPIVVVHRRQTAECPLDSIERNKGGVEAVVSKNLVVPLVSAVGKVVLYGV